MKAKPPAKPKIPQQPIKPYKPLPPSQTIKHFTKTLYVHEAGTYNLGKLLANLNQELPNFDPNEITITVDLEGDEYNRTANIYITATNVPNSNYQEQYQNYLEQIKNYTLKEQEYKSKMRQWRKEYKQYQQEVDRLNLENHKSIVKQLEAKIAKNDSTRKTKSVRA